jgi:uncharacterized protein YndB with AHSA1/START domain
MITFKQTGTVDAPVEKVFSIVADFKRIPEWRTDVPGISQINGGATAGATFLEEVQFMGRKQLLMKVIEVVPNRKLVIEAQSGMSLLPTQSFTFTNEAGKTRVDLTVNMKVSGLFRLMQPMLPPKLKKVWANYFVNLNSLVQKKYVAG